MKHYDIPSANIARGIPRFLNALSLTHQFLDPQNHHYNHRVLRSFDKKISWGHEKIKKKEK